MNFFYEIITANTQELVLIFFILLGVVFSFMNKKELNEKARAFAITAICTVFVSALFVNITFSPDQFFIYSKSNIFTAVMKVLVLLSTLFVVLLSKKFIKNFANKAFEYYTLLLTGTLGAFCLIIANDFITTFVSMEMIGLSCFVLTGFSGKEKAKEGAIKYLIQSTVASAVFLFGVSYLYGLSGAVFFDEITEIYLTGAPTFFFPAFGIITLCGIMFKLGCVPFTNWIPDIYEGSSYPVGAYISLVPKIAAFGFLIRIVNSLFSEMPVVMAALIIIALVSVLFGSLGAIRQNNIKRLWGYSSIIQSGFILAAVAMNSVYSVSTVIFYLVAYIFMNFGVWCASYQFNLHSGSDLIEDIKGLYKKRPYFSLAYTICIVSLVGLPITSGFLAKLYLFSSIIREGMDFGYVILFLLCFSIIAMFAYFNVIKNMFVSSSKLLPLNFRFKTADFLLYLCAFITVAICIMPNTIVGITQIVSYFAN